MSVSHIYIVYGIAETPEMKDGRRISVEKQKTVCPNGHSVAPSDVHCSACGKKTQQEIYTVERLADAAVAYSPAGVYTDNEFALDAVRDEWVHGAMACGDDPDVAIGILLRKKRGPGVYSAPEPTDAQRVDVIAYFAHLGIDAVPRLVVVGLEAQTQDL